MTCHGVLAMVGYLGVKPLMDGGNQQGIAAPVVELSAPRNILVDDAQFARLGTFQRVQARHLSAMDVAGTRKITFKELTLYVLQVQPHQRDLGAVLWASRDHLLDAAFGVFGENVERGGQIEWHHVLASLGYLCLALGLRHGRHVRRVVHVHVVHAHHRRGTGLCLGNNGGQQCGGQGKGMTHLGMGWGWMAHPKAVAWCCNMILVI